MRAVATLERAGPDALSLAISARYADALRASRAGTVLVPQGLAQDPGPSPHRRGRPRTGVWCGWSNSSSPSPPRPRASIPRLESAPAVRSGRKSASALTPCWAAMCAWAIGSGSGERLPRRRCLHRGRQRARPPRGLLPRGPDREPGGTQGRGGDRGRRVRVSFHRRRARQSRTSGGVSWKSTWRWVHSCVDRGSLDDTIVGRGTKLDNLARGTIVRIGERRLLMAGVGVAGAHGSERRDPGGTRWGYRPSPDWGMERGSREERCLRRRGGRAVSAATRRGPIASSSGAGRAVSPHAPADQAGAPRRAPGWVGGRWPGQPSSGIGLHTGARTTAR